MHESGLVDLDTFESVVEQEHQEQVERSGNRNQLQKIAKVIMRLSLVQHQWWHEDTYTCNVCNGDQ